ncbi:hypothetical protein QQ045_016654 [Rhodiola kirilowii]
MKLLYVLMLSVATISLAVLNVSAQQCGRQAGGALCQNGLCCSQHGYCGTTPDYCGTGCQSQCGGNPPSTPTPIPSGGGWATAPDGAFAWGYCHSRELNRATYCSSPEYPCPAGRQYYGRGPIQLTHNYNYAKAGAAIRSDLINNPDLVATDPVITFRTAIWFWMTPQGNKPSSHDVIIGRWTPSSADVSAGRVPGYGVITNIINGGLECGKGQNAAVASRIGFYKRYCDMFQVGYGNNLDCNNQRSF